jgi:hypothetical protein
VIVVHRNLLRVAGGEDLDEILDARLIDREFRALESRAERGRMRPERPVGEHQTFAGDGERATEADALEQRWHRHAAFLRMGSGPFDAGTSGTPSRDVM